jgi:UDP-2,4-diacetamido-2,4,6-trideoxy-beta-L-altropyranose hydrolase
MERKVDVVLRADASPGIGAGHLIRTSALARAFAADGVDVAMVTQTRDDDLLDDLQRASIAVVRLDPLPPGDDATATAALATDGGLIVVDGYHFDVDYLTALRSRGCRTTVIDDKPRLPEYSADALIDQNPGALRQPYSAPSAHLLLGPRFMLLRPLAPRSARRSSRLRMRALVSFGGSDVGNVLPRVLRALATVADVDVTAVLGALNRRADQIIEEFSGVPHLTIHRHVADLSTLMSDCDIAIASVGGTLWELAALGIPALTISSTDVQRPIAAIAHAYGAHRWIGDAAEVEVEHIRAEFLDLCGREHARAEMARLGQALVDGRGAWRASRALLGRPGDWTVRPSRADDIEPIWEIASDPSVRQSAFESRTFTFAEHEAWFRAKMAAGRTRFWVVDSDGTIGGFIRYDRTDDGRDGEIDIAVAPAARRRGLATRLLRETWMEASRSLGVARVRGVVLEGNIASGRAFLAAGFKASAQDVVRNRRCSVFERAVVSA